MSSTVAASPPTHDTHSIGSSQDALRYFVPAGRVLYALIFVLAGLSHFSAQTIGYAASQGVPMPNIMVPLSGVLAVLGGLSIAFGYKARFGALLLIVFLIPVTLLMHRFWMTSDANMAPIQQAMFMKNLSMLGAAILISYFGAGPLSLDARYPARA